MAIFVGNHKIVEVGKLHGLLSGHMIAQMPYSNAGISTFDNGFILAMNKAAASGELKLAGASDKEVFLHYTEELMNGFYAGLEYFAIEKDSDGKFYPRAIALYPGDEFVTNNVAAVPAAGTPVLAQPVAGVLTATDNPAEGFPVFRMEKDVLPSGVAAAKVTYLGLAD